MNRVLYVLLIASIHHGFSTASAQATRTIETAPTYYGTLDGQGACTPDHTYHSVGFEPDDAGDARHPLFLYFVGTTNQAGIDYDRGVPLDVTKALAARGFVALSISYDNTWGALGNSDKSAQLRCLFDASESNSLIAKACAMPHVDCAAGVAVWGHSQGGLIALRAADYEPRVRAAWAAGAGLAVLPFGLDRSRVRVLNGVTDVAEHTPAAMEQITDAVRGRDCPESSSQCLRAAGSGWVIVPAASGLTGGHCWFMRNGCFGDLSSAPAFSSLGAEVPYSLAANADWVQATIARP